MAQFIKFPHCRTMNWRAEIRRMELNARDGWMEIETSDGEIVRQDGRHIFDDLDPDTFQEFPRTAYFPQARTLTLEDASGDVLEVEVFDPAIPDKERRRGRPSIYLDQNIWIRLAQAIHSPARVPSAELGAAEQLIGLAEAQAVILPLSSGHWIETGRTYGRQRQDLAPLMARLSRGWIMKDPLLARDEEFDAAIAGFPASPDSVITLDPHQRNKALSTTSALGDDSDLPPDMAGLVNSLSMIDAMFSVFVMDDASPSPEGRAVAAAWANSFKELAIHLRDNRQSRAQLDAVVFARYLDDVKTELAQAGARSGMTAERFGDWVRSDAYDQISRLPYQGRVLELLGRRLRNAEETWEGNDLVDIMYLGLATTACDYVVGERTHCSHLRNIQRSRSDGAKVALSLKQLVEILEL
jgi:hypothetical protein